MKDDHPRCRLFRIKMALNLHPRFGDGKALVDGPQEATQATMMKRMGLYLRICKIKGLMPPLALFAATITFACAAHSKTIVKSDCDIYRKFHNECNCLEDDDYLINYGYKYCERFRTQTGWTPLGKQWRDRTLVCLKQALIDTWDGSCNCEQIKYTAFQSHAFCYTQKPASFCELPKNDVDLIFSIVDFWDMLSPLGIQQAFAVTSSCLLQARKDQ